MFRHLLAPVLLVLAIIGAGAFVAALDRTMPPGFVGLRDRLHFVALMSRLSEAGTAVFSGANDELVNQAVALLSIEPAEVHDVLDSDAGLLIKTKDGSTYIVVGEDSPDAEGKYGVMFLVAPSPKYGGNFPVYAQPVIEAAISSVAAAVSFADLAELEDDIVEDLSGGGELDDPTLRPDDPRIPVGSPADVAHEGVLDATAAALAADQGPPSEPVPAPGPEHAEDVVEAATAGKAPVDQAADKAEAAGDPVDPEKVAAAKAATDPPKRGRRS